MKNYSLSLLVILLNFVFTSQGYAEVQSLRGDVIETPSTASEVKDYLKDQHPLNRDYLQQPPLIPHQVEGYMVNLKHNKCLSCHSWQNYKLHNATKISQTHFQSRDGAIMSNVSARRYFCQQCHVPQVNAPPLVDNTFDSIETMRIN